MFCFSNEIRLLECLTALASKLQIKIYSFLVRDPLKLKNTVTYWRGLNATNETYECELDVLLSHGYANFQQHS